jgi:RsiW-degrading membrane proteinase PrsW (M82 family)
MAAALHHRSTPARRRATHPDARRSVDERSPAIGGRASAPTGGRLVSARVKGGTAGAENHLVGLLRRHLGDATLLALGLALSVRAAFSATLTGDYPVDAQPALTALLHRNLHAFALARPAMGDLSLLVRAPFAALAYLGDATTLSTYRWGTLPCVVSVALLGLWLARIARSRGVGMVGQLLIVTLSVLNPLTSSAIALGHPEELLTASLCVGALVAALKQRTVLTMVLLGLALACKQWSVVTILPTLFALERSRIRTLVGALAVAALVTIPEVVGSPSTYLANQLSLAHADQSESSVWSWLWPFGPNGTRYVLIEGALVPVTLHRFPRALIASLHSLIIVLDAVIAVVIARLRALPLRRDDVFALMAVVLLLRCALDNETMPYYHAPLLLDLLAWDAFTAKRLPLRALSGALLSWLLFDRLTPSFVGAAAPSSILYGISAAVVLALLVRSFIATSPPSRQRIVGRFSLSA